MTKKLPAHLRKRFDELVKRRAKGVNWGTFEGRQRLPCPEDPVALSGAPIGMYHCPGCGEMQIAGVPHLPPDEEYELAYGEPWPPGYKD